MQIYENALRTMHGSINGMILSNPHSEIYPWTGDPYGCCRALDAHHQLLPFWRKVLQDYADAQVVANNCGGLPETAPNFRNINNIGEPAWSIDYPHMLWGCWQRYGDKELSLNTCLTSPSCAAITLPN